MQKSEMLSVDELKLRSKILDSTRDPERYEVVYARQLLDRIYSELIYEEGLTVNKVGNIIAKAKLKSFFSRTPSEFIHVNPNTDVSAYDAGRLLITVKDFYVWLTWTDNSWRINYGRVPAKSKTRSWILQVGNKDS
jgi:hypothetical protein